MNGLWQGGACCLSFERGHSSIRCFTGAQFTSHAEQKGGLMLTKMMVSSRYFLGGLYVNVQRDLMP